MSLGPPPPEASAHPSTLREVLDTSRSRGDRIHLVFGHRRMTFAEHHARAAALSTRLRDRFGVGPGDRVMVYADNSPEWILTYWATVGSGAILAAANSWWMTEEIDHAVREVTPTVLFTDRERAERMADLDPICEIVVIEDEPELFEPDPAISDLVPVEIAPDDPADILFTSGTTGRAKGALHSHRNTLALIESIRRRNAAVPRDPNAPEPVALSTSPLFHLTGLHAGAIMSLAEGRRIVWTTGRFDPVQAMELIESERCTTWAGAGTPVWRVVSHPRVGEFDLSSMRYIAVGAGAISPDLLDGIRRAFPAAGTATGNAYGLTESTGVGTKTSDPDAPQGCVGHPSELIEVSIRDDDGRVLPDGEIGEICLRGPSIMLGYWNRPEDTAAAFHPERWLRTGDVGRLVDGQLHLASRRSDLIVRGGENVYPAEVEHVLERHPAVVEAAVVGVDDPEMGQRIRAILVTRDGMAPDDDELRRWSLERLARFKAPDEWVLRSEPLPRTATGKVMRVGLTDLGEP